MGASQSYQKADEQSTIDFQDDIDNLNSFLNYEFPTITMATSTIGDTDFFNKIRTKIEKRGVGTQTNISDIFDKLEKIKRSIDLIMLYDNYNLKNSVIIKDLSKKSINQLSEIKKRTEYTDLINHELNVIKHKINNNNKTDKTLLIFIIIFVLLIIIFGFITALKFVKL
tara:strand:- start:119 stop:625 length:507 start_codon:yes stop_codon:yes gene_type:complete